MQPDGFVKVADLTVKTGQDTLLCVLSAFWLPVRLNHKQLLAHLVQILGVEQAHFFDFAFEFELMLDQFLRASLQQIEYSFVLFVEQLFIG